MSYIGQGLPADTFQGFVTDSFTGDGSATTFTLSKEPFSEDTLIVVINNVIQKPTTNFTVSGTTLTIVGSAVASGDVIYAIHMGGPLPIGGAAKLDLNGASDKLILDADADTTISADTDDQIDFKAGGTDIFQLTATTATFNDGVEITTADNTDTLTLTSTDADANAGPNLRLYRNSGSPADSDLLGQIDFEGRNDNSQDVVYASILNFIDDASDGTEDSQFTIKTMKAGSLDDRLTIGSNITVFNDGSKDVDFRVESDGLTHALFVDAGNNKVIVGDSSGDGTQFDVVDGAASGAGGTMQVHQTEATNYPTLVVHQSGGGGNAADIQGLHIKVDGQNGGTGYSFVCETTNTGNFTNRPTRIRGDGKMLINTTNTTGTALNIAGAGNDFTMLCQNADTASGISFISFRDGANEQCGNITGNASNNAAAYNTSSDYRLKENIVTDWDGTSLLKQLKPSRFNFKKNPDKTVIDGFIAHEAKSVVPHAVTGEKDEVESRKNVVCSAKGFYISDGFTEDEWKAAKERGEFPSDSTWHAEKNDIPVYQGIDQGKLVPVLTKALQELEARVTALEG